MIKADHYCTVTLIEDSLITGASSQELVPLIEPPLMNVCTKNLNDGMESIVSSFADSNTYRGAVIVPEGRAAVQRDYSRLEEGLT